MICCVVPAARAGGFHAYLSTEGQALVSRMQILPYEDLLRSRRTPLATYVFAGLDQICPAERELAAIVADRIAESGANVRVLNHPRDVRLRYDLLREAYDTGLNSFRAVRATAASPRPNAKSPNDAIETLRYPVFLREENDHNGGLSSLLQDRQALEKGIVSLVLRGYRLDDLLIVEFCDTSDYDLIFRKYSAFIVGDRILPRYLNVSRAWMVKQTTRLYDMELADEELEFLASNPHAQWLERIFDLARVRYGRIDYGLKNGVPQVWEINTNPTIGRNPRSRRRTPEQERYHSRMTPGRERFYESFFAAWEAVDSTATGSIDFELPGALVRQLATEKTAQRRAATRANAARWLAHNAWARAIKRGIEPAAHRVAPFLLRFVPRPH
jgi:hypothetical protein